MYDLCEHMDRQATSISIVLPVFNEAGNIETTMQETVNFFKQEKFFPEYEIIIVDDGSTDNSPRVLDGLSGKIERLSVVRHAQNRGYGAALVTGIKKARHPWILLMDADGQFKINSILDMIPRMNSCDVLAGYRRKRTDSRIRILLGKTYTYLAFLLFKVKLKDINCGFKLLRKDIIDIDAVSSHGGAFYTDFFIKTQKKGCRIEQVPVEHFPRLKGKQTGASFKVVLAAMIDVFRLFFIDR